MTEHRKLVKTTIQSGESSRSKEKATIKRSCGGGKKFWSVGWREMVGKLMSKEGRGRSISPWGRFAGGPRSSKGGDSPKQQTKVRWREKKQ